MANGRSLQLRRAEPGTTAFVAAFVIYLLILVLVFRQWREDEFTRVFGGLDLAHVHSGGGSGAALLWLLVWGLVCAPVGLMIGRLRGQPRMGAAWGLGLGPIGWLVAAGMKDRRPKCPSCLGVIPEGAQRCMHCGQEALVWTKG